MAIGIAIGQVIHRHRYSSPFIVLSFLESVVYLGEAASDLHVLSFHSLNTLPMCVHYTLDSAFCSSAIARVLAEYF